MKIAIIGANGYIARNLIYKINEDYKDAEMYLYDVQEEHRDGCSSYSKIDITNIDTLSSIKFDVDIIFYFSGKTGTFEGFENFNTFIDINEKGLLNFLNRMVLSESKAKLIFPSTRLVYKGKNKKIKENDTKEFKTLYAMNKYACEQYLKQYRDVYHINYLIMRICVPYGSLIENVSSYGTAEFMVNKAKKGENITLYGDGSQRRTITYIGDLCDILIKSALSNECINDVYNIGGEDYSLFEMATLISKLYGVGVNCIEWPLNAKVIESGSTVFDSSKLDSLGISLYNHNFKKWCILEEVE